MPENIDIKIANKTAELNAAIEEQGELVSEALIFAIEKGMGDEEILNTGVYTKEEIVEARTKYQSGKTEQGKSNSETEDSRETKPTTETNQEKGGEKSLEELNVDKAREEYVKEYLKCKKEVRNKVRIDKIKTSIGNLFRTDEKAKVFKEEDYFTKEYKEKKEVYDKARVEYGNKLFNEKKAQLEAAGLHGEELDKQMKVYKATEILAKTILDEHQKLIEAKAEGSPVNPSAWKALWNKYQKLPRWKKVAISAVVFGSAASAGSLGVAGAVGYRFVRGMVSGTLAAYSAKTADWAYEKGNKKFKASQDEKYNSIKEKFGAGEITQEEYEKESSKLQNEERKRARNQTLVKAGIGIAVGAGVGALAAHEFGSMSGPHHQDSTGGTHNPDNSTVKTNPLDNNNQSTTTTQPTIDHKVIDAEVGKGHGAIQTIRELQEKLKAEYPDGAVRPASVDHILNTKADKLAMEYGMFKPGQDIVNESALFKVGGKFEVDQSGNVSYQENPISQSTLLEKGDELKASGAYDGKMFDSDHSGRIPTENNFKGAPVPTGEEIDQTIPQITDEGAPVPTGEEAYIEQTIPKIEDAQIDPNHLDNLDQGGNTTPVPKGDDLIDKAVKPEVEKPLTRAEIFSRDANTGGVRPIYPTSGNPDMYARPTSTEVQGNGFTREVPMTNREAEEFYGSRNINAKEAITVRDENVVNDPRHLETATDVRETFGGRNVEVTEPQRSGVTNGMRTEEWNKYSDDMFKQKDIKFDDYAEYEKERQLQEFFGHGEKGVIYDAGLDKNVEGANMYYFRETDAWQNAKNIPAREFFDFNQSELTNGSAENTEKLNSLLKSGVIEDKVSRAGIHNYSFTHEKELERIARAYAKVDPLNATPIGNETMESYIARVTRDLHKTDDGTLYMFKNQSLEKSVDDGSFMDRKIEREANLRSRPTGMRNSSYSSGGYYYSPRTTGLANRANDIIGDFFGYSKWTH